ncbi:MAG: hypothetical protein ACT4ON_10540 [Bacteroidota bacterium]
MKLQRLLYCLVFSLMLQSVTYGLSPTDTIRLNPIPKKTTPYPQQPIIIKTNPTAILWGPIFFTAEYRLMVEMPSSKNQSIQFGISYLGKSPIWAIVEKQAGTGWQPHFVINGIRIQFANKFYLTRKKYGSPFGFYIAPHVSYSNAHISLSKSRAYRKVYIDATQFSANLLVGLQVGRGKKFTADVFAGLGYKKNTWIYHSTSYKSTPYDTEDFGVLFNFPIKLTLGLNLGWALY